MREVAYKIFEFPELSEAAQKKVIDYFRETAEFDHEDLLEEIKGQLELIGFSDVRVNFSGFCSQGDGACFTGTYLKPDKEINRDSIFFITWHKYLDEFLKLPSDLSVKISHRGRYYHEKSVSFDFDDVENEAFIEICHDLMKEIYRTLEKEYEYQNSDEWIKETILANEYEFYENGKIYNEKL